MFKTKTEKIKVLFKSKQQPKQGQKSIVKLVEKYLRIIKGLGKHIRNTNLKKFKQIFFLNWRNINVCVVKKIHIEEISGKRMSTLSLLL